MLLITAVLLLPVAASAAELNYTGMGYRDIVTIDANIGGQVVEGSYYAGQIKWDWTAPIPDGFQGSIVTYCVDIVNELTSPQQVTVGTTNDPLLVTPATDGGAKAAWLLNSFGSMVSSGLEAAALQVAIWEALYDNDHNVTSGSFAIVTTDAAYTGAATALAIAAQADTYLKQLFSAGAPNGQYYTSTATWLDASSVTGGQDQITTPEPSSLMLLGMAGLFVRRRLRRA
jgi:hypothetical protein